jgi:hypothetical protein
MFLKNEFHVAAADTPILKSNTLNIDKVMTTSEHTIISFTAKYSGTIRVNLKMMFVGDSSTFEPTYILSIMENGIKIAEEEVFTLTRNMQQGDEAIPSIVYADFSVVKGNNYVVQLSSDAPTPTAGSKMKFTGASVSGVLIMDEVIE